MTLFESLKQAHRDVSFKEVNVGDVIAFPSMMFCRQFPLPRRNFGKVIQKKREHIAVEIPGKDNLKILQKGTHSFDIPRFCAAEEVEEETFMIRNKCDLTYSVTLQKEPHRGKKIAIVKSKKNKLLLAFEALAALPFDTQAILVEIPRRAAAPEKERHFVLIASTRLSHVVLPALPEKKSSKANDDLAIKYRENTLKYCVKSEWKVAKEAIFHLSYEDDIAKERQLKMLSKIT